MARAALAGPLALLIACTAPGGPPPQPATHGAPGGPGPDHLLPCGLTREQLARLRRGYWAGRSGDLQLVPRAPNYLGAYRSHSGPWDYLQEVPLLLYGPGHVPAAGEVGASVTVADVAPTLAEHMRFPFDTDGSPLPEAEPDPGQEEPRVVVVVVWDGVGGNVLEQHPDSWPTLRSLIERGAWYPGATVGSSPSVTAAVHATIGTGTFPSTHGRVANRFRFRGRMAAMEQIGPSDLEVPSLADLWDRSVGGLAHVGLVAYRQWHLGMAGHGASFPGGDRDIAVLMDEATGRWYLPAHDRGPFRMPPYIGSVSAVEAHLRHLDLADGMSDGLWRGEDLDDAAVAVASPAYARWQTEVLEALVLKEGFGSDGTTDLLFTNYKQADLVSHRWGMESRRMAEAVNAADDALRDLIEMLDDVVGRGEWMLALTADHGSTPPPRSTGATVIDEDRLVAAIRSRFDRDGDGRSVLLALSPSQAWLDETELDEGGVNAADVARFVAAYDGLGSGGEAQGTGSGGRLFSGAFPSSLLYSPRCAEP